MRNVYFEPEAHNWVKMKAVYPNDITAMLTVYWSITVRSMYYGSDVLNVVVPFPVFIDLVLERVQGCCIYNIGWEGIPDVCYPVTEESGPDGWVVLLFLHFEAVVSGYAMTLDFTIEVEGFFMHTVFTLAVLKHFYHISTHPSVCKTREFEIFETLLIRHVG